MYMVYFKLWVFTVSLFMSVCNWAFVTDFFLPPSGLPPQLLTSLFDPLHLDIPPPCLHAYAYIHLYIHT